MFTKKATAHSYLFAVKMQLDFNTKFNIDFKNVTVDKRTRNCSIIESYCKPTLPDNHKPKRHFFGVFQLKNIKIESICVIYVTSSFSISYYSVLRLISKIELEQNVHSITLDIHASANERSPQYLTLVSNFHLE